jgi:hypothetical protein
MAVIEFFSYCIELADAFKNIKYEKESFNQISNQFYNGCLFVN